jgi:hypothetical protein
MLLELRANVVGCNPLCFVGCQKKNKSNLNKSEWIGMNDE